MATTEAHRLRRRERKARRRLHRLLTRRPARGAKSGSGGPARKHWERRRAGTANSAPQLRNRTTHSDEDAIIGGSVPRGQVTRGYQPTAVQEQNFKRRWKRG